MNKGLVLVGVPDDNCLYPNLFQEKLQYIFPGNEDISTLLNTIKFEKLVLLPYGSQSIDLRHLNQYKIIINAICNPDANQRTLLKAKQICRYITPNKVINHPNRITQTSRDKIYQIFNDQFIVPRTYRLIPAKLKDIESFIIERKIHFPFLFRDTKSHGGINLLKIDNIEELDKLERFPFDGRGYFITEFYDYKSADGYYRKYRAFCIDGRFYPRHLITSKNWNIHASNRKELMHIKSFELEENEYLEKFPHEQSLSPIYEKIALDYFAIDYTTTSDKEILIFEINSCATLLSNEKQLFLPQVKKIVDAINAMIEKRVQDG